MVSRFKMSKQDLSKLARELLNDPKLVEHNEKIAQKIVNEVQASSDNAGKFKWEHETFKDGDRTTVRIGSNSDGAKRYEFFSGRLYNSTQKKR